MSLQHSDLNFDDGIFGAVHLGYVVIETNKFDDWKRFGADAIGLHVDTLTPDVMRFRMDDRSCRFLLLRGDAEDVTALGWEVDDHETFDVIAARVSDGSIPLVEGTEEECALRGVQRLIRFAGPKGIVQELFTTADLTSEPLRMKNSGWVTGEAGLGHVAITSRAPELMRNYFNNVFDARLSDYIDETISGIKLKIRFLRVNERHHSIAIASVRGIRMDPIRTRVQHLNIQALTLDDMTLSYQRVKELGFHMAHAVGQHTNDKELSYYAKTPSGFEWEVGWNPITVDERIWEPTTHQGISIWGHTPEGAAIVELMSQFRTAIRNSAKDEITVPELSVARS